MSLLEEFGAYAAEASAGELPADLRARLAVHWRDALGALAAGALLSEAHSLAVLISRLESPLLCHAAAFAGALRMTEIDDIDRRSGVTAAAVAVPAALGMVRTAGKGAEERVLDAFAAGYEIAVRLAEAAGGAPLLARGVWPTYLVAPAGAAAAAARVIGLDRRATANALAIALARAAPGIGHPPGPRPVRWYAFTQAVRDGCAAALAAADGVTGDTEILERGWFAVRTGRSGASDTQALRRGLGREHAVMRASIKPFCSAKQVLAAIDAFRRLLADGIDVASIETVIVRVPVAYAAMIGQPAFPTARIPSIVSARYQLSLAALVPEALYDIRRDPPHRTPEMEAMAARVQVVPDEGLAADYPGAWPAEVTVRAAGRVRTLRVADSAGDPAQPFDAAAVEKKYRSVFGHLVSPVQARRWQTFVDAAAGDVARIGTLVKAVAAALEG